MAERLLGAVIALVIAGWAVARLHRWLAVQWFLVRLWRFLSGHTHHGRPVTDAGWLRPGTRALTPTGHATRWHHLPRLHRAGYRSGGAFAVLLVLWGLLENALVTVAVLAVLAICALVLAVLMSVRVVRARGHRRTWLHPLHLAAHELAGHPRAALASSWIRAELDAAGAVDKVVLALPPGWPADARDKDRLVSIASAKTGIEAPEASWRLAGPAPLLTLTHSPPPPGHVKLADVLGEMEKCRDDEVVIGIGKNDSVIRASLGSDSPHIALSMGTGAGKSNLAGFILFQMLVRGGIGLVLDAKRRLSYPWLLKDEDRRLVQLPNVAYAWTTAQMHESMAWLSDELDRRGDVAFAGMDTRGRVHANVGSRLFVLAEELNLAVPRLKAHWSENRDPDDPAKSPAFTGLGGVAFAGRQVKMHLVLIGQMLTAEATGSRDSSVKENCGVKLLARYGPKGWRVMAEDIPMPPPPSVLGRVQVVTGGVVREAQVPEMDEVLARQMVLDGIVSPMPPLMPCTARPPVPVTAVPALASGSDLGGVTVTTPRPVTPLPGRVTLSEAVRRGLLHPETTLAALRMARFRDPDFPAARGQQRTAHEYDAAALAAWDEARRT